MTSAQSQYSDFHREFDEIIGHAAAVLDAQAGSKVRNERENYGEKIFGKIICHAMSLKRILPNPAPSKDSLIWDISSAYALSRTILESYEALAYVVSGTVSKQELECRIQAWKLHAQERRFKVLSLIGSRDPRLAEVEENIRELREVVLAPQYNEFIPKNVRGKIEKGDCPPYLNSRSQRLAAANVNADYFTAALMNLSSHVHTHPFSLHQLFDFKAGTPEAYGLMKVSGQYACGFLSASVRDISNLFYPRLPETPANVQDTLDIWCGVLETGVKLA